MATTSYGSISQRTAAWAADEMLAHAMPIVLLGGMGQQKPIPKNTADNAKFRRPIPFPAALAPLTEGVTPPSKAMQYQDVSVQLQQYGDIVEITDKVQDMAEDPVLKDATGLIGEQVAETKESLIWGTLRGGTSVYYTNGSARSAVNTAITLNAIRAAVRFLKSQRAQTITQKISASTSYATAPVAPAYVAVGHTDIEADLRAISQFVPVENYASQGGVLPYEVGKIEGVRFCLSPLLTPFTDAGGNPGGTMKYTSNAGAADVYPILIFGKDAFGQTMLRGANAVTPMVLNPGEPRGGDPLGQRGTVGWKTYFAAVRLNESWMVRIEAAVTKLP